MVPIAVLLAVGIAAVAAVGVFGCWTIFHPPKMLPHSIWPQQYGLPYESVEFRGGGLVFKGWLIPAASRTDRTLVLCHGWGDNKGALLEHTRFLQQNFNLFYFDFRHHGESEGALTTIGCLETIDIEAALEFLARRRPEWTRRMGIYGHSMGASLAVWAGARHPEIKAVAVEAPFASFNEVVAQWAKNAFHLPYFPFVWAILAMIRLRLGMDPDRCSPIHQIEGIHPRPLFFIAGDQDRLMPLPVVRQLYEAARNPKELWIIPGASHGKCETIAGEEYHRRLKDFFLRYL